MCKSRLDFGRNIVAVVSQAANTEKGAGDWILRL
jgi:hypothetical protein